jgi:hypothetical protein
MEQVAKTVGWTFGMRFKCASNRVQIRFEFSSKYTSKKLQNRTATPCEGRQKNLRKPAARLINAYKRGQRALEKSL